MSLDGEAEQLYPHSWRILSLVDLGDSIIARIRRLHLRPSPTFGYSSRYAEAEPLFKKALAILEEALGSDPPSIGRVLNNLALLYVDQRKNSDAEPLYQRALAIREKALGSAHPYVAESLENYAALLHETGRSAEAAKMVARAKAIRAKHAGQNLANQRMPASG